MNDLDLLRRFEPIIYFTSGEMFFPRAVDEYVRHCSLWEVDNRGKARELVADGKLDLSVLAEHDEVAVGHVLYMRFVPEPMPPLEYQQWLSRPGRVKFKAPDRLARVPLISRIGDAIFDLSLALRGVVPGGTAAAAEVRVREMEKRDVRNVYYGRVVRDGFWTTLHYIYFYPMNNWRSGFYGVNDHEADWEQAFIYLYQDEAGDYVPHWVAYAAHDGQGDELRRRWDDPALVKEGEHPVIYAGAGSHASYFERGDYLMGFEPGWIVPLKRVIDNLRRFWVETLKQGDNEEFIEQVGAWLSVPFVDYARGDGVAIGPHKPKSWIPVPISDSDGWVNNYRGLWGLDTRDRFGGERAPAGPKYDRSGAVRRSWYDPLGWAGLDKLYPPSMLPGEIDKRIASIGEQLGALNETIGHEMRALRTLALDVQALRAAEHFNDVLVVREKEQLAKKADFQDMVRRRMLLTETRNALLAYKKRVAQGNLGPPAAHIRHAHHPSEPVEHHRVMELWAAISGGLALLAFGYLIIYRPVKWFLLAIIIGVVFGFVDALTRGRSDRYLAGITVGLAAVNAIILLVVFWKIALILPLALLALSMLRENFRELS
ncbi:MAG: hypothetical protein LC131_06270 [Anaerolineae bacterium]|nr:hypothetical protein [Anaerolineae bacterium]